MWVAITTKANLPISYAKINLVIKLKKKKSFCAHISSMDFHFISFIFCFYFFQNRLLQLLTALCSGCGVILSEVYSLGVSLDVSQ